MPRAVCGPPSAQLQELAQAGGRGRGESLRLRPADHPLTADGSPDYPDVSDHDGAAGGHKAPKPEPPRPSPLMGPQPVNGALACWKHSRPHLLLCAEQPASMKMCGLIEKVNWEESKAISPSPKTSFPLFHRWLPIRPGDVRPPVLMHRQPPAAALALPSWVDELMKDSQTWYSYMGRLEKFHTQKPKHVSILQGLPSWKSSTPAPHQTLRWHRGAWVE